MYHQKRLKWSKFQLYQDLQKQCFPHLWDPWAAGVRRKHLNQTNCQEGEGQSPVDVHEIVHDVRAGALQRGADEEGGKS